MVLPDQVFGKPPNPLIFFHNWFINILIWGEWYTAFFQTHTHIIIIFVGYLFSNLYPINMPLVSFAQIPQISCYVYIYVYNVYIYIYSWRIISHMIPKYHIISPWRKTSPVILKGEVSHRVEVTLGELQEALSAKKLCLGWWVSCPSRDDCS